jgi:hypothetical protein
MPTKLCKMLLLLPLCSLPYSFGAAFALWYVCPSASTAARRSPTFRQALSTVPGMVSATLPVSVEASGNGSHFGTTHGTLGSVLSGLLLHLQPQRDSGKVFDCIVRPAMAAKARFCGRRRAFNVPVLPQDCTVSKVRAYILASLTRVMSAFRTSLLGYSLPILGFWP